MGYISTGMGDRFSALIMSLMALQLALVDRNPFRPCFFFFFHQTVMEFLILMRSLLFQCTLLVFLIASKLCSVLRFCSLHIQTEKLCGLVTLLKIVVKFFEYEELVKKSCYSGKMSYNCTYNCFFG